MRVIGRSGVWDLDVLGFGVLAFFMALFIFWIIMLGVGIFQYLEQMSQIPSIMKTIAKGLLRTSEHSKSKPVHQNEEIVWKNIIHDDEDDLSEKDSASIQTVKGRKWKQKAKGKRKEQDQDQESEEQEEDLEGNEIKQKQKQVNTEENGQIGEVINYFIDLQKKKLQLQYPTFEVSKIKQIAEQLWKDLSKHEQQKYKKKLFQKQQNEQRQLQALQALVAQQPNSNSNSFPSKQKQTKNQPDNFSESQPSLPHESYSNSNNEDSSTVQARPTGEEDRSNAETRTSQFVSQLSNHVVLHPVYALIQERNLGDGALTGQETSGDDQDDQEDQEDQGDQDTQEELGEQGEGGGQKLGRRS